MIPSQLFTLRDKINKYSLNEFKRYIEQQRTKLDLSIMANLVDYVYSHDTFKKNWIDYLAFFANFDSRIMHAEMNGHRRLLQDLCFKGRNVDFREVSKLALDFGEDLKSYTINGLIGASIDGTDSSDTVIQLMHQILNLEKYLNPKKELEGDLNFIVRYALKKELLTAAFELLKHKIGRLTVQAEELFMLSSLKIPKKQAETLYKFVDLYLSTTKFNPRQINEQGRTFYDRFPRDYQIKIEEIIRDYSRSPDRRQPVRRSQNKVRSSMGAGEYPKPYSESLNESSKEKMIINIQNFEDEKLIQNEASKIHEKYVLEKEKYHRYEKLQRKEVQPRVGIIKSEELRYYLEEDIMFEVDRIKEENNKYRPYFLEVVDKVRERLTGQLHIEIEVFGSFETSLCLEESDIDIVVIPRNLDEQAHPATFLQKVSHMLEDKDMSEYIEEVNLIKTASVPIIKVTCTASYYHKKIDFTYKDKRHNGLKSVQLIRKYLDQYPQLQPLIFILKQFIYTSGLSAPYKGGLSSYGLILMIVAYIQQAYKMNEVEKKQKKLSVADLLIGFLKFYGFKMNYVMKCITLVNRDNQNEWKNYSGCIAPYSDPYNPIDLQPKLAIMDPLDEQNNVGRSTHKIKQIQMAFEIAYITIHTFKQCGKKRRCDSYRRIAKANVDVPYNENERPCCIIKRMFRCTQKFIKE